MNFRNHLVKITTCLALTGIIVLGFRALAASEDVKTPTQLSIAAAADLTFALDDLVKEFEDDHPPIKVKVTYGSSGIFFARIRGGAPFDLFFSADMAYPRKLAEAGLAADDAFFLYAIGRIVVWVSKDSPLAVDKLGIKALLEPSVRRIAIANPWNAPYGRAAVAALNVLNVYDQVASRLVYGENICQAAELVENGAADVCILAQSIALAPQMLHKGRFWQVPADAYPRMEQGGMILKSSKNIEMARSFRDLVLGDHGHEVLERYGFSLPGKG